MPLSPRNTAEKRDLHVGGLGVSPSGALAAVVDPLVDASETWMHRARDLVRTTDDYIRDNPWQAIGMVALVGVTLGFMLSRRS
jgi:ElaB/YqjD/DUF883 family membrane-anchored ribosome-binding protein